MSNGMIGIFGDSFAEIIPGSVTEPLGWPSLLRKHYNGKVIHEAAGASSLFWSYNNFMRLENQCEKIIFIVTNATRYTKPLTIQGKTQHFNGMATIDYFRKNAGPLTEVEENMLNDLAAFYRVMDIEWDDLSCQLLVDHIRKIRPDTILIPITPNNKAFDENTVCMYDFVYYQLKCLKANMPFDRFYAKYSELEMACHFTPEVNKLVYNEMLKSLAAGKWVGKIPDELITHEYPFHQYYVKK